MTKNPKTEKEPGGYESALGPIPLDQFGNDIPVTGGVDKSPGSLYEHGAKIIDEAKKKPEGKK